MIKNGNIGNHHQTSASFSIEYNKRELPNLAASRANTRCTKCVFTDSFCHRTQCQTLWTRNPNAKLYGRENQHKDQGAQTHHVAAAKK
jgi:hypothetical protein